MLRRALLVLALALGLTSAAQAQPQPLTVFAAASLKNVLDEQGAAFTAAGGPPVRFSYGASSAMARQIEQGAPADLFLSADVDWMSYVAGKGLIVPGSRRNLLTNRLALIAPAGSTVKLTVAKGMPIGRALGDGRLAIAAPEVPAGRYGRAALAALGVWPQVRDRLAPAENVRAALQFVARGETPLGVVYDTDARVEPGVRIVGLFPETSHPRILYPAAILKRSANPAAARFLAFLQSPRGRAIFQKYGFTVLR
ncbi:molybdate transport system substrate-binding protein [Caulobacter ginsengisoli]|uniref:Molybdate transport system substrate-binding protein n=1 Tax=Caulobacter ginsengisoli TaxID=400775 RepID=A0ABU0ITL1_9CAUL|nr:molybdate ABC transporter substrate-binding protein [Caulobacter ginsengisoli]MDQ0465340.1 molybdate transport system substrate-binding protein [Caulobacter ginsengisoli]